MNRAAPTKFGVQYFNSEALTKEKDNHNTIVPALLGIEPNIN